jgi:hypothetical protein
MLHRSFVIHGAEGEFFQLIDALSSSGRFTRGLDSGKQQCDEHANDGDDYQEFDERKSGFAPTAFQSHSTPFRGQRECVVEEYSHHITVRQKSIIDVNGAVRRFVKPLR